MRLIGIRQPAPAGSIFAAEAFDRLIGAPVVVREALEMEWGDGPNEAVLARSGTLIGADVADDGRSVWLQVELDDDELR